MKKGQVWIETVLYTLIGLAIMGVILSIVKPTLDQKRDQLILNQATEILDAIEGQISDVIYRGEGNTRTVEVTLKKGKIVINTANDSIDFYMDSKHLFSELDREVNIGKIIVMTTEKAKKSYAVHMSLRYPHYDIVYDGEDREKTLQQSSTPYKIAMTNQGKQGEERTKIDFIAR
jgi:hypothetical protein